MELSERVKQLFKNKKVTPYEVSIDTGVSQAAISRMLSGVTGKINSRTARLLSEYFNVDAYWLRTGEGEMTTSNIKPDAFDPAVERQIPSDIEKELRIWPQDPKNTIGQMKLGERVRLLIDKKRVTAYEIYIKTGISQSTLSRITRNDTAKLNIRNSELLANYFEVSLLWLRTGEGEMTTSNIKPDAFDPAVERQIPSDIEKELRIWTQDPKNTIGQMKLGERVRLLIDKKRVTAYEIYIKTGISQSTLSRITRNDTAKLNIKNLGILAEYFNVSYEWLRTGEGEKMENCEPNYISLLTVKQQKSSDDNETLTLRQSDHKNTKDHSNLGERVRLLINNKRVTPYEVATRSGISQATISRILSGITNKLSINNSLLLADYFHVTHEWLTTGLGEMALEVLKPVLHAPVELLSNIEVDRMRWTIEQLKETVSELKKEKDDAIREASKWQTIAQSEAKKMEGYSLDLQFQNDKHV